MTRAVPEAFREDRSGNIPAMTDRAVGPDVSHFHPIVDMGRLLDTGVSFIGMKVSQGSSYVDPWFGRHLQLARDAGDRLAARLLYHFIEGGVDPVKQARRFMSLVGTPAPGDVLVGDVEERRAGDVVNPPPAIEEVEAFFSELPASCRQACYVSARIWSLIGNPTWARASEVGLWAPRYSDGAAEPALPRSAAGPVWPQWDFWQYSQGDAFPGVDGPADGNYFRGTSAELRAWALLRNPDGSVRA